MALSDKKIVKGTGRPKGARGAKSKYNKGIAAFIASKVEDGMSLKQLNEKYPEVPAPKTIIDWKKKFPEFNQMMKEAYGTQIYNQMDEMKDLSEELLIIDKELRAKIEEAKISGDPDKMKEALMFAKINSATLRDRRDNIRVRIDTIKFSLAKLAHIFLSEFKESPKQQVQVNVPSVQIISYAEVKEQDPLKLEDNK